MSKKNRPNHRSLKEAQKAQQVISSAKVVTAPHNASKQTPSDLKNASFTLPIAAIKKDLMKDLAYAVFAVALITVLGVTNFGYTQLTQLFTF